MAGLAVVLDAIEPQRQRLAGVLRGAVFERLGEDLAARRVGITHAEQVGDRRADVHDPARPRDPEPLPDALSMEVERHVTLGARDQEAVIDRGNAVIRTDDDRRVVRQSARAHPVDQCADARVDASQRVLVLRRGAAVGVGEEVRLAEIGDEQPDFRPTLQIFLDPGDHHVVRPVDRVARQRHDPRLPLRLAEVLDVHRAVGDRRHHVGEPLDADRPAEVVVHHAVHLGAGPGEDAGERRIGERTIDGVQSLRVSGTLPGEASQTLPVQVQGRSIEVAGR